MTPPCDSVDGRAVERVSLRAGDGAWAEALLHPGAAADAHEVLFLPHGSWGARAPLWSAAIGELAAISGLTVLELVPSRRLAPAFPGALVDAAAALAWLAARTGDGRKVGVIGEGNGANLAAALAAIDRRVGAAVLLSGIYDIPALLSGERPVDIAPVRAYLGARFLAAAADHRVSPACADLARFPPAFLACGARGPHPEQTLAMTAALANADVPVTCALFAGAEDEPAAGAELERALAWLHRTLASPPPRIGDARHPQRIAVAG
jgi:acetyl esterase/lipase